MTDPSSAPSVPGPAADASAVDDRVVRLERRIERERTARQEAERIAEGGMRELWQANRLLEDRVAERTAELEQSLAAVTMAADAKERFLAELGHDLATPLHTVLGLLELVESDRLEPHDRDRIESVREHATRLSDLLRGLVDLAGADGAPAPGEVVAGDPATWLDDVVASWTKPAARRAQLLVPAVRGSSGAVRTDWTRLRRAVDAVMSNVTTHADAGTVGVDVTVSDGRITVDVTDAGPGIPPELAATAHEPFVATGASAGIGIGLSIADRLVRSAGGAMVVSGDRGATSVTLSLPTS